MKSNRHKVLHEVCGKPMILHVLDQLAGLQLDQIIVVVGQRRETVEAVIRNRATAVFQAEQLGTGHAVQCAVGSLHETVDSIVVLNGDGPLIRADTVGQLLDEREQQEAAAAVLTADLENPFGFGRVLLAANGQVARIVEEKDATPEERAGRRVNSGVYAFSTRDLVGALADLKADNAQGEYYLTDVIGILRAANKAAIAVGVADTDEILGVNDRVQLALVESIMRRRVAEHWMRAGVTMTDPGTAYIGPDVSLGRDVTLLPGVVLEGRTSVGDGCVLGPNARIANSEIDDNVTVQYSVVADSTVKSGAAVGPFAYIRPGSVIGERVKIGDFVEVKNARIGADTKVSHLAYIGDAEVGNQVNVGCGVITVNYDGERKHRTVIGDGSFVGSNANLIAPVAIGAGAYVCAGSTITDDVGDDGFAIARPAQVTKSAYVRAWKLRRGVPDGQSK